MKKFWKETVKNIGHIQEGQKVQVIFETVKDISDIVEEFYPRCGSCTSVEKYENNKLYLSYKANAIPYHLEFQNQPVRKFIDVYYKDGSIDTLEIIGVIKNKNMIQ